MRTFVNRSREMEFLGRILSRFGEEDAMSPDLAAGRILWSTMAQSKEPRM
jgi:hypothetical protein